MKKLNKDMTTLVIHPADASTVFLKDIYCDIDCTVVTGNITHKKLREMVIAHERIIMLGHGTPSGLINTTGMDLIIDSRMVDILQTKECVAIWCNADVFFEKYRLTGFYTGMIISEVGEASMCGIVSNQDEIDENNASFASAVKSGIQSEDMYDIAKDTFQIVDAVTLYNHNRIYSSRA